MKVDEMEKLVESKTELKTALSLIQRVDAEKHSMNFDTLSYVQLEK